MYAQIIIMRIKSGIFDVHKNPFNPVDKIVSLKICVFGGRKSGLKWLKNQNICQTRQEKKYC